MDNLSKLVWITGLSGSGKTTISKLLQKKLKINKINALLLDGDEIREAMNYTQNYSWEDRKKIAFNYAKLAKLFSDQGFYVIVSTISMFEEVRRWNRQNNSNYLEIYLNISKQERERRDPKKLYLSNQDLVDINHSYEEPQNPDMVFDSEQNLSSEEIVEKIYQLLQLVKKETS